MKPEKEKDIREIFRETEINITVEGQKHLGAAIGSQQYRDEYFSEKVSEWVSEVAQLAEFALTRSATGVLRRLYIWPETSMGVFFKYIAGH